MMRLGLVPNGRNSATPVTLEVGVIVVPVSPEAPLIVRAGAEDVSSKSNAFAPDGMVIVLLPDARDSV